MFKSIAWDFAGKFSNQIIAFIVSVILARLLSPSEFGVVGIALVFVNISTLFLDLGFRNTLVHKQDGSDELYSTVLLLNLFGAFFLAALFFLTSGFISRFYNEPLVKAVVQAITILFIINAATLVPNALNAKELRFKSLAIISIISSVVSGIIAIWMAYTGWGIWSLIARNIISAFVACILNWIICSWKFVWKFRIASIKQVWGYSSRLFATTIMEVIFMRFDVLIIGKLFSSSVVGYYTRAQSLDNITRELTSGTMTSVFLPYFSKIQSNADEVLSLYKQCLHMVSFILLVMSGVFFLNADQIFVLLFTDKWLPAASLYKVLTMVGFVFTINVVMNILLCGIGMSKEFLQVEVLKKSLILLIYIFGFFGSISLFLYLLLLAYMGGLVLNMHYVYRAIAISIKEQLVIILRYLFPAIVSIIICFFLFNNRIINPFLHILMTGLVYCISFYLINYLMKNPALGILNYRIKGYWLILRSSIKQK